MSDKTEAEVLREKLAIRNEHFLKDHADEIEKADAFCEGYKAFLQRAKTERECNKAILEKAALLGFVPFDPFGSYKPGDKVYVDNRGKSVILCVFGKKSVAENRTLLKEVLYIILIIIVGEEERDNGHCRYEQSESVFVP